MKFSFRKLSWKIMQYLPSDVRFSIIRAGIEIKIQYLTGVKFKIATTQDEIEQGFKLLYDCYLSDGMMNENMSQLRITKFHLMPTSTMIVGVKNGEVIATVTHILDSHFGLPCDGQTDFTELRKPPLIIAEISSLAIKKGYRRQFSVLFALTRFLYNYSVNHCGVNYWVICIRKRVQDYYRAIFFFTPLSQKEFKYGFVNGLESVILKAELKGLVGLFENHYKSQPPEKNLYDFYLHADREEMEVSPDFVFKTSTLPILTPDMLRYFFNQRTSILSELTAGERQEVLNAYHDPHYAKISELNVDGKPNRRSSPRRAVNIRGFLITTEGLINQIINLSILNVSRGGLLLYSRHGLPDERELELQIEIVQNQTIIVNVEIISEISENKFACRIEEENNPAWVQFIEAIETHLREFSTANDVALSVAQRLKGDKR